MAKELLTEENECSIVITTASDRESARTIAGLLVEKRLAACVQMFPIESVYLWKGEICAGNETALFIKTTSALLDKISQAIKENHAYEVPEIIQVPITGGLKEYLAWIGGCTANEFFS